MSWILIFALMVTASCTKKKEIVINPTVKNTAVDSSVMIKDSIPLKQIAPLYANERFKDVIVQKIDDDQIKITGKGQIFEASFSWVITNENAELTKGSAMTDAGAPEWGKFDFKITIPKQYKGAKLTLVLFEISAKDGSRQHELQIPLNV